MITIITPTYNRAYILTNAYESLCRQTCRDFEWIVVDDGSTDNTEELVRQWQEETKAFSVVYEQQKNGGKHRAVNRGVQMAKAEYVLVLDSDDYLTDDAVEVVHQWIEQINDKPEIAAVVGLRGWRNKEGVIGGAPKSDYVDAAYPERVKLDLQGDKAEVYRTQIMRKYPFPEFEGENFLRESAMWDAVALDGYKLRWYNRIIYKCEYLEDGLTQNTDQEKYARNFQGWTYCCALAMKTLAFPYRELRIGFFRQTAKLLQKTDKEICDLLGISLPRLYLGWAIYKIRNLFRR